MKLKVEHVFPAFLMLLGLSTGIGQSGPISARVPVDPGPYRTEVAWLLFGVCAAWFKKITDSK